MRHLFAGEVICFIGKGTQSRPDMEREASLACLDVTDSVQGASLVVIGGHASAFAPTRKHRQALNQGVCAEYRRALKAFRHRMQEDSTAVLNEHPELLEQWRPLQVAWACTI